MKDKRQASGIGGQEARGESTYIEKRKRDLACLESKALSLPPARPPVPRPLSVHLPLGFLLNTKL